MEWSPVDTHVIRTYGRPLAHMRRQLDAARLGLILGAGVNRAVGFPDWADLVDRISEHPEVEASGVITAGESVPLPITTQILLNHYGERRRASGFAEARNSRDELRLIDAGFRRIMHECLYRDVPVDPAELRSRDTFYRHYLDVIRRSTLTVTYNFDDTVERLLLLDRTPKQRETELGFETVIDARQQFRLSRGVIYHPNGYLPLNLVETKSEPVVFSAEALADQLIESFAGHYATLLNHLSKNTGLLIGLSLSDETLLHILRQSAKISPGHYHYYVKYVADGSLPRSEREVAEARANFDVFNLITLFLDGEGIAALGRLLTAERQQLRQLYDDEGVSLAYTYYLVGVPGVGKTTTLSHFKNLVTYDEWLEERLPEMGKPWTELTPDEERRVDEWVMAQVSLKNRRIVYEAQEDPVGVTIIDRCVPDAISFTPKDRQPEKAEELIDAIAPGKSGLRVHPGHVILLTGDPAEIVVRACVSGRETTEDYTRALQDATRTVYDARGVTRLDTRDMTVAEVVRAVADVIHRHEYVECDVQGILERFASGKGADAAR